MIEWGISLIEKTMAWQVVVIGSNSVFFTFTEIAQLVERSSPKRLVAGSTPAFRVL